MVKGTFSSFASVSEAPRVGVLSIFFIVFDVVRFGQVWSFMVVNGCRVPYLISPSRSRPSPPFRLIAAILHLSCSHSLNYWVQAVALFLLVSIPFD